MLLSYGIGKQPSSWHVLESKAPMFARVYFIQGGKATYRTGSLIRPLKKGYLYIFPAHTEYEMTTDSDDTINCMHMHLDLRSVNLTHLISVDIQQDIQIQNLIKTICDAIKSDMPFSYIESLAEAFESLCLIRNLFETVDNETESYISALRRTYKTNTDITHLASEFGYSPEYFIRIFKKKMGISPHQYVISLRMSDAVRMLSGNFSLDEIASNIGYVDGHSFSNTFRRYFGISPALYREHYAHIM